MKSFLSGLALMVADRFLFATWVIFQVRRVVQFLCLMKGSAGVLTVATNFYEFVEVEDLMANPEDPGSWTYLTTEQLEEGKEYYIYVTTTGGLYRYDINDIIKVEGFYNKTPQIIFLRKGKRYDQYNR